MPKNVIISLDGRVRAPLSTKPRDLDSLAHQMSGLDDIRNAASQHAAAEQAAELARLGEADDWRRLKAEMEELAVKVAKAAEAAGISFTGRAKQQVIKEDRGGGWGPFKRTTEHVVQRSVQPESYRIDLDEPQRYGYLCFEVSPHGEVLWLRCHEEDTNVSGHGAHWECIAGRIVRVSGELMSSSKVHPPPE